MVDLPGAGIRLPSAPPGLLFRQVLPDRPDVVGQSLWGQAGSSEAGGGSIRTYLSSAWGMPRASRAWGPTGSGCR